MISTILFIGLIPRASAEPNPDASYVGGKLCGECHAEQVQKWTGSHHDLAMQTVSDKTVLGDFADVTFTHYGVTSIFYRDSKRFMVRTEGATGELEDFEIRYVFGVYPLQQYLIEFPGGRLQALGLAWDATTRTAATDVVREVLAGARHPGAPIYMELDLFQQRLELRIAGEQVIEWTAYGAFLTRRANRGPVASPQGVFRCRPSAREKRYEKRDVALAVATDAQWSALVELALLASEPRATSPRCSGAHRRRRDDAPCAPSGGRDAPGRGGPRPACRDQPAQNLPVRHRQRHGPRPAPHDVRQPYVQRRTSVAIARPAAVEKSTES